MPTPPQGERESSCWKFSKSAEFSDKRRPQDGLASIGKGFADRQVMKTIMLLLGMMLTGCIIHPHRHHDHYCHDHCDHYWWRDGWHRSHRHYHGCGHIFIHGRWTIRDH